MPTQEWTKRGPTRISTRNTASPKTRSRSSRRWSARWNLAWMSKPIEEILAPKPEARLRIYAWTPNDPPADYVGLIKVGQTTRDDVNERIRQSQGQMQQAYTLARRCSRRARGRHDVPGQRCSPASDRQGLRERRHRLVTRVDALLARRREDRGDRAPDRACVSPAPTTRRSRCAASRPRP